LDGLFLLPLALWQTLGAGYSLTSRDLLVVLVLGVVCTAVAYALWMEGTSRVRVQHSAVLGFLTPVSAPAYALILLGQTVTAWTVAGGALILAAGILVVLRGQQDFESEPPM
jgi:drug/metabolite transporter (DMT)-like permease